MAILLPLEKMILIGVSHGNSYMKRDLGYGGKIPPE
jgi:hypothetical protein